MCTATLEHILRKVIHIILDGEEIKDTGGILLSVIGNFHDAYIGWV